MKKINWELFFENTSIIEELQEFAEGQGLRPFATFVRGYNDPALSAQITLLERMPAKQARRLARRAWFRRSR